jgi:Tol biopolymer transport system component
MKNFQFLLLLVSGFLACNKTPPPVPKSEINGKVLYFNRSERLLVKQLPDGGGDLIAAPAYAARWSNSGNQFLTYDAQQLYIYDAATRAIQEQIQLNGDLGGICWSIDDQRIAIPIFNTRRIELLQLDNYQYTQLNIPEGHLLSGDIDWSGVNDLLVFRTRDASTDEGRICTMKSDGSGFRVLVSGNVDYPRWATDGHKIAYEEYIQQEIYLINPDGSGQQRLWQGRRPCWSANGQYLMFNRTWAGWTEKDSGSEIWMKEIGGKQRESVLIESKNSLQDWWPQ